MNTRDMIADFQRAFQRPISDTLVKSPSVSDRLLLGSILLEEVIETITLGLGLTINSGNGIAADKGGSLLSVGHREGDFYDPIETADGLGDINVVIHFNAHWLGMNLDRITQEINDSNMSKLAEDGTPIINGVTPGYRGGIDWKATLAAQSGKQSSHDPDFENEEGFRADLPIGKILKGPNFRQPDIAAVIGLCPNVGCPLEGKPHRHGDSMEASMTRSGPAAAMVAHVDSSIVSDGAALDHCSEHPDQTTANCEGGFGLAGGGYGAYSICGKCGGIFGKTDDGDDFG